MATVIAPPKAKRPAPAGPGGPPPLDGSGFPGGGGGNWGGGPDEAALTVQRYKTGVWFGLASVVMIFAGFISAFVVRKGAGLDWQPIAMPAILGFNTALLLVSSFTLERARRRRDGSQPKWLGITSMLGAAFLALQYVAWRQLAAAGVYLASNPASSFFYLLTGAHGLHLLGGVIALFYVTVRAWRGTVWRRREAAIQATSLYWHFMDGLWVFLFFLLWVGR
jgi:cytochrome c oxidase subunit 3